MITVDYCKHTMSTKLFRRRNALSIEYLDHLIIHLFAGLLVVLEVVQLSHDGLTVRDEAEVRVVCLYLSASRAVRSSLHVPVCP